MATTDKRWQEWASFALGLWLAVSPWAMGYVEHEAAAANAIFVGLALALGSHFQATLGEIRGQWLNLGAGAWLVVAPFVLGFADHTVATATSISVGSFVAGLAGSALAPYKHTLH